MALTDHRFLKGKRSNIAGQNLLRDDNQRNKALTEYTFLTAIVKDVISNPYEYLSRQFANTEYTLREVLSGKVFPEVTIGETKVDIVDMTKNIENFELIETMPINSIFAYIVDDYKATDTGKYVVCYPFFPPHLSLPLKPGEYVWIITEKIGQLTYYYWMSRKVAPIQVDDVNFTNFERIPATNSIISAYENENQGNYDLEECYSIDEIKESSGKKIKGSISGGTNSPEAMSNLFIKSYAFNKEFTGEPVPRLAKDCGDLLLQGSNNSGIQLTTEKFLRSSYDNTKYSLGDINSTSEYTKPDSPAVDIYVGRKKESRRQIAYAGRSSFFDSKRSQTDKMNFAANNSEAGTYDFIENDKMASFRLNDQDAFKNEVHDNISDGIDVAARLYLSHNCDVDTVFGSRFDVLSPGSGETIVTYANINRVIGEQETRIVSKAGESFIDMNALGNVVIKASKNNGQQFLSLGNNGITRLQARDKIELSVRNNNDIPEEPYVKYSVLKEIIESLQKQIIMLSEVVVEVAPFVTAAKSAESIALANAGDIVGSIDASNSATNIETYSALANTEILSMQPSNTGNLLSKLNSTKIFGE